MNTDEVGFGGACRLVLLGRRGEGRNHELTRMNANGRGLPAAFASRGPADLADERRCFGGACGLVLLGRWRPVGSS